MHEQRIRYPHPRPNSGFVVILYMYTVYRAISIQYIAKIYVVYIYIESSFLLQYTSAIYCIEQALYTIYIYYTSKAVIRWAGVGVPYSLPKADWALWKGPACPSKTGNVRNALAVGANLQKNPRAQIYDL